MKKLLLVSFLTMFVGSQAHAGFIQTVTGADMTGMQVTVTYEDATYETLSWETLTTDASVDYLEGYSGGVTGSGFSLVQQGDTIGEYIEGVTYGIWTLTNMSSQSIVSLFIDAIAGSVVFDTEFGNDILNGSGAGREFVAATSGVTGTFDTAYLDELYGSLTVEGDNGVLLASGESLQFLADTEIVSAPATLSILMLSLFGLMNARRKQA